MCGPDLDVLDPLVRLVDHSLVTVTDGPRYHLPESVGAYALERLAESGETEPAETRHGAYYAGLAEQADLRGRFTEARRSLQETLAPAGDVPADLRDTVAVWHAGFTLLTGGDAPAATPESDDALATWFLGYALFASGKDLGRSEDVMARAMTCFQATGDRWGVAATRSVQTRQAFMRGDLTAAREYGESAHALFEELDDRWGRLQTTYPLAALAETSGDYERAARLHRDGHQLAEELGFWTEAADRLTGLGRIALLNGDFRGAEELHGQAMRVAAEHGYAAGKVHAEIGLALGARREGDLDEAEVRLRRLLAWHRARDFGPGPALLPAELGFVAELHGDARTRWSCTAKGWMWHVPVAIRGHTRSHWRGWPVYTRWQESPHGPPACWGRRPGFANPREPRCRRPNAATWTASPPGTAPPWTGRSSPPSSPPMRPTGMASSTQRPASSPRTTQARPGAFTSRRELRECMGQEDRMDPCRRHHRELRIRPPADGTAFQETLAEFLATYRDWTLDDPALFAQAGAVFDAAAGDQRVDLQLAHQEAVLVVVVAAVGEYHLGALAGPAALAAYLRDGVRQRA
ncbi:tetratricopeptide (TPR) repeat protein [Nonomuraea rubra]|uniref:Tetratricopeptide (TPR) repeat protein n=1 Tax=Nonomuraea rubra TaxID=46180 RepID=A0A7X0U0A8_9ACTN|nr:tetratricopeptide (TPR) repeat protein [Nonomuraea rubra]